MKKLSNDYKNAIAVCLISLFCVCAYYGMKRRFAYVEENGVWTVYTLGRVRFHSKGGLHAPTYYKFNGEKYRGGTGVSDDEGFRAEGRRFFMMIVPKKPNKIMYMSRYPVPSWFTLDAPPEGWPTKPTEAELWDMMQRDSLERGLKHLMQKRQE